MATAATIAIQDRPNALKSPFMFNFEIIIIKVLTNSQKWF